MRVITYRLYTVVEHEPELTREWLIYPFQGSGIVKVYGTYYDVTGLSETFQLCFPKSRTVAIEGAIHKFLVQVTTNSPINAKSQKEKFISLLITEE